MATKISRSILESYLSCRFKGHLKVVGQQGTKCDYEVLRAEMKDDVRLAAIDKILSSHPDDEISRHVPLTTSTLKKEASFILDGTLEDDVFSLAFDGLKRVDGPSKLGGFHYVPVLFSEGETVGKEQRSLLQILGLLISRLQQQMPVYGVIWYGKQCKTAKVRLNSDLRSTERLLRELKEMCGADSPPPLILNDHCQVCEFKSRCHAQAVQEDNISLLRSLGPNEIKKYARKGILTVTQLAHTFRPRRKPKRAAQTSKKRYHALQALAIRDKRIYVFGTPELKVSPVTMYMDVESFSERGAVYLIGVLVVENGSETGHSLWADDHEQEQQIFEQFLEIVGKYPNSSLFCYGAFERDFLKRMSKHAADKTLVEGVLSRLTNTLSLIYDHIYFPTYSNGLKDIGRFVGCEWSDPESTGIQSIVWKSRWEDTKDVEWKQKILTYNLEDCAALKKVTELILGIAANVGPKTGTLSIGEESFPVSSMQDLDKLTNDRKWGPTHYFHSEYQYVNSCAYFDYQREKVFVRTNQSIRKRAKQKKFGRRNKRLRISMRLKFTSTNCPNCNCDELTTTFEGSKFKTERPRIKRAFDLVVTASGIKRRVIESRSEMYECRNCQQRFVPKEHDQLDKHFHGLKSWAMYQHVAHRLSACTIQSMLYEFFGLWISDAELLMFKSLLAVHYRTTCSNLLTKILSGNLLHADETEVKLRTGKGYVWVFTNLEEVVFMFKPTREGDFLKDLLKDFKGVVVSDFYAAYDSLDCPQQKCLIHLMRDMNQELLNNPYDSELQLITQPFGTLLRDVVSTVDEHGLKKTHLHRHQRAIAKFFENLSAQSFRSEAAEAVRHRLLKYKSKLFTFIDYDGVPWNNNNAENAIKRFAYYREGTVGTMKEAGLSDYLVLLSICHTCRYKGVSFLRFMLSRETDMDVFCGGKRHKNPHPIVETYPDGFVPPLFRKKRAAKMQSSATGIEPVVELVREFENQPLESTSK